MSPSWFARLFESGSRPAAPPRRRLTADVTPARLYAIGDVHGCLDLLRALEGKIVADARGKPGESWIVMLGDYVDRGPQSAQVIDHLLEPPPAGFRRVCLAGNHETSMLGFIDNPRANAAWLGFGGIETLQSYGIADPGRLAPGSRRMRQALDGHIPPEHREFLARLPLLLDLPGHIFVHAGLLPGIGLAQQDERTLLWFRDDFRATYSELTKTVVHGHTPRETALVSPRRIAIDTGAYLSGRLTAVRLTETGDPVVFTVTSSGVDAGAA